MPRGKALDKSPSRKKGFDALTKPGRKEKKVKMLASPWLQKLIPGIAHGVAPGQSPRVTWEQPGSPLVQPQGSQEQSPGAAWSSIVSAPGLAWPVLLTSI